MNVPIENILKLPICEPIREGSFIVNDDGERIERGDVIQIFAPKSRFHKMICIFSEIKNGVEIWYNRGGEYPEGWDRVDPIDERLTWEDFKFVKYEEGK